MHEHPEGTPEGTRRAATLAALRALYALLEPPERWTQGSAARNATGKPVRILAGDATCWCLTGAMRRPCWNGVLHGRVYAALMALADTTIALPWWNDAAERTHADVLALIQAAIEAECLAVGE